VKTKNLMVGALLALLVLVLFYRVVYGSMQSQASKAKKSQQNYETQIGALQQQLKAASPGGNGAPTKGVSKDELAAAVPPAANEAEFLRILDQIRDASGVTVQQISPTSPTGTSGGGAATASQTTPAGVTAISVGITVQGTFDQVQDYVNRLMHAPRLIVIDGENVTVGGSSGDSQSGGAAVGPVFAGQGQPAQLQVSITARLFTLGTASTGNANSATGATPVATTPGTTNS
jgi:hypothetical protein